MLSLRALLAAVAVPLIALALTANLGFYTLPSMLAVLLAAVLLIVACLRPDRTLTPAPPWAKAALFAPAVGAVAYLVWQSAGESSPLKAQILAPLAAAGAVAVLLAYLSRRQPADPLAGLLIGCGVLLSGATVLTPQLRFGEPDNPVLTLHTQLGLLACLILMFLVWLSFLADPAGHGRLARRGWWVRWGLLLVAGTALRGLAVVGSPEPVIDVHCWLQNAPRLLLEGKNPYAAPYPSPYGTERAARFQIGDPPLEHPLAYAPGVILSGLPAALLGLDVRWVNVLAETAAAVLIVLVGGKAGGLARGLLASGLYLCLPRSAFVTEQSWYEPQLAALTGLLVLLAPTRPWAAGVTLGGLLALKQYLLAWLPALVRMGRERRLMLGVAAAVAALLYLPFVVWDPASFWQYGVAGHLERPVIYFSLILPAIFRNEWGFELPRVLMWGLEAVLLLLLAWRMPAAGQGPTALWLAATMLVFNLCSSQGFPNYYYLVLFLLLLGLAQAEDGTTDATAPAQSPPA